MRNVVPSDVVSVINQLYPQDGTVSPLGRDNANHLNAILDLIDRIPQHLITLDEKENTFFLMSLSMIRNAIRMWSNGYTGNMGYVPGVPRGNPVNVIREALKKCLDDYPSPETSELSFIEDKELRESLRFDSYLIGRSLSNLEWKPATILAGSFIEALLLWGIEATGKESISKAIGLFIKEHSRKIESNPKEWNLEKYCHIARILSLIKEDTLKAVMIAKDYRNLIHPGRELRLEQRCDKGTAYLAAGAVERVVRDLSGFFKEKGVPT